MDLTASPLVELPTPPRRSPRGISVPRLIPPSAPDGSSNVAGLPFHPLLPDEEGVVPQPRRSSILAAEELPEGRRLRQLRVLGCHLVTVFPSTIPNAGRGLFAFRTIPPLSELAEYKGVFSLTPPLSCDSPFTMELPAGAGYITGDPALCFGVFMNDCFDDLLTNTRIKWCPSRRKAFVVSGTLPINPGEECFTSFGATYWSSARQRALLSHAHSQIASHRWLAESSSRRSHPPRASCLNEASPPPREWWQSASDSSDDDDSARSPTPSLRASQRPSHLAVLPPDVGSSHGGAGVVGTPSVSPPSRDGQVAPPDLDQREDSVTSADYSLSSLDTDNGSDDGWLDDLNDETPFLPPDTGPEPPPLHESRAAWFREAGVRPLLKWIQHFFPETDTAEPEVNDLLVKSFELGSSVFGVAAANTWAEGFVIPPEAIARDDALWVACNHQFERVVEAKRMAIAAGRLSVERVERALNHDNPHREAVLDLAINGISLCTPAQYTGCGVDSIPPVGALFKDTAAPVERMMFESYWEEGLSIILSETRVRTLESLGLCLASWAAKLGKSCGRPITNGSGRRHMPQSRIINGRQTKLNAIKKYGHINNPVIGDVARLIERFRASRRIPMSAVRMWKYDIAAAYQKLTYPAAAVSHVGVELRNRTFMFFLGGVFGLTSMPFAFNIITKAVVWELNSRLIKGMMLQYVDDGFVVSHQDERDADVTITLGFIRDLLGPDAIAIHKLDLATTSIASPSSSQCHGETSTSPSIFSIKSTCSAGLRCLFGSCSAWLRWVVVTATSVRS